MPNIPATERKGAKYQPSFSHRNLKTPDQRNGKNQYDNVNQRIGNSPHEELVSQVEARAVD